MSGSFSADWVVPVRGGPIRNATLELDATGRIVDLRAGRTDNHVRGAILPALVNAHVHVELSALRQKAPGGQGLLAWVGSMLAAREALDGEASRAAMKAAVEELERYGTCAIGEVTNSLEAVKEIVGSKLCGIVFHEVLDSDPLARGDAIGRARAARAVTGELPPKLRYAMVPHAPYSVSGETIARLSAAATEGVPLTIHLGEDKQEILLLRDGTGHWPRVLRRLGLWEHARWAPGMTPVEHLEALGFLACRPPPLLVHMVHATAEDFRLVAARNATVVLCPRSNLHIGRSLPDVPALVAAGCSAALGTDSLASNETLSIWSEMATIARHFPEVPAETIVRWATLGGANALMLGRQLGALEPGTRPGVIAVEGDVGADPYRFLATAEPVRVRWLAYASIDGPAALVNE